MNKKELITAIAEETGMTKKDVATVVDATFDKITAAMVAGDKVQLMGFGTFETRERGERTGKNPCNKNFRLTVQIIAIMKITANILSNA